MIYCIGYVGHWNNSNDKPYIVMRCSDQTAEELQRGDLVSYDGRWHERCAYCAGWHCRTLREAIRLLKNNVKASLLKNNTYLVTHSRGRGGGYKLKKLHVRKTCGQNA